MYSCFEFEQTCRATPHRSLGAERWPAVVSQLEGEGPQLSEIGSLQDQLEACVKWYTKTFGYLLTENTLNLTNINGIIPGIVFIGLDFKTIISSDPTHEELKFNESRPNTALWDLVAKVLRNLLPAFSTQTVAYLQWAYGEKEEKTWEVGSRPPVGRYAPRRGRPSPNRSDRGERNDRGGNRNERPDRKDRGERGGNRRGGAQKGGNPRRNNEKKGGGSSEQKEKLALTDVNKAVEKLGQEPGLSEIKLKPANSFYRRLQHKHAISQGFESTSSGEGNDRSVVVKRAKD